jgi:hypothetical protein
MCTIKKDIETLLVACKNSGLEENSEKVSTCECPSDRMHENSYHLERKQIL